MIEQGTLPDGVSVDHIKKEQLPPVKPAGKTIQDLTGRQIILISFRLIKLMILQNHLLTKQFFGLLM